MTNTGSSSPTTPDNTIGGTSPAAANVISGNENDGVLLNKGATGNLVEGNDIGTNSNGTSAVGNGGSGIEVVDNDNTIGGTATGEGNRISGNSADGVLIDSSASGVAVQGNYIGTDVTGTIYLANSMAGIEADGSNNAIGGSVAGASNIIADNSQGGVLVSKGTGDAILSNSIYANGSTGTGPGITLSNSGNNNLAAPSLTATSLNGSTLTVYGSFNSPSANTYVLEFFANPNSDEEGKVYLGSLTVTSTNTSVQSFTFTTTTTATGTYPLITATLTDNSGNTSPFSNGEMANSAPYAPTVTTNPSSQIVWANQGATFTAYANGNPTPTVQWQVSSDGGKTFTNISGATSSTLTLTGATTAMNGYEYEAVFTNSAGSATTSAATLTVNASSAPSISGNPSSLTVTVGSSVNFTASASGSPTPTVQWQYSLDGGNSWSTATDGPTFSDATSTTLTVWAATTNISGWEFRAVFTNFLGSATTSAATLTVGTPSAPTITGNPSNQTVTAGQSAAFTASASGNPRPTVQWQVSSDGGKTFTDISGATNTTLTLNNVTTAMNGNEYQAVFTNSVSSATTSAATLTVTAAVAPSITGNPSNQTVTAGQNATFTGSASGSPTPTVQWQASNDGGKTFTDISGATSTTLTLTNVTADMNGNEYQAVFTNSAGSATSTAATLTVQFAPTITTNPSSQTVTSGGNVSFTAAANGNPTPTVQWQVSTDGGKTFSNINSATSTTLTLSNISDALNGYEYRAVFTNSIGSTTSSAATLTIHDAPTVTVNPSSQTVMAGQSATFTAAANGNPTPMVQWQVSTDGGKTFSNISGATSTTLTLTNVSFALNGHEYRAVFTNSAGSGTTPAAILTVQTAPAFTSGNSATFTVGQGGSFTLTAAGSPTPTLTASGVLPSGVTFTNNGNGTGTLHGIPAPGASGTYHFAITAHNATGSDALQNFMLVVNPSAPTVPPLLAFLAQLLGGIETMNAHGASITGYFFGIPLLSATFDDSGNLQDATLLGFDITFLVKLFT